MDGWMDVPKGYINGRHGIADGWTDVSEAYINDRRVGGLMEVRIH
jgi:hypothetical protein